MSQQRKIYRASKGREEDRKSYRRAKFIAALAPVMVSAVLGRCR